MVLQHTRFQGIPQHIPFLEEIDGTVFIPEYAVVINSPECSATVLSEQLLPSCQLTVARPVLTAEAGFPVGRDIIVKRSLARSAYAPLETEIETVFQLDRLVREWVFRSDEYDSACGARAVNGS